MSMNTPEEATRPLTPAEIEAFHHDGAVRVEGAIPAHWLDRITAAVEYVLDNPTVLAQATAVLGGGGFSGDAFMWKTHDGFRDFMFYSPAARLAQQVLRSPTINAFYDQIFAKPAGSGAPTPFHEDVSSWPVSGDKVCAMWMPLDPCGPDSAALQVIRGSHRWRGSYLPVTPSAGQMKAADGYQAVPDPADRKVLSWDLVPGDMVLFHPAAVHGATGTGSARGRRAFVSRWVGDDMRFEPRHAVLPLLWDHGLTAGDPIGGPLFPRILPEPIPAEVDGRLAGPESPDGPRTEQFLAIMKML
ncbi:phytanoyl-CoA dioxygenase family protein [Nonomuraea sp. NPDC050556]|uniref:phytanoyl-CoA dioxygenase family protein n=1 Tax=Nonomuraea sp. NPDC050556 TaxID=3364369 RepID=UPI0037970CB0